MRGDEPARWDDHLVGVALAAGVDPRGSILARCWQGSWLWNLMIANVHRPRVFIGHDQAGRILAWSFTSAGHEVAEFRRDDVDVTVRLPPVLVRAKVVVGDGAERRTYKVQFNGPVACRRFLSWM